MRTYPYPGFDGCLRALDYEEGSITAIAGGLTASKVSSQVSHILLRFESGPSRYTLHGTVPTASFGYPAYDGDEIMLSPQAATALRMIRTGATNGTFRAMYFTRL